MLSLTLQDDDLKDKPPGVKTISLCCLFCTPCSNIQLSFHNSRAEAVAIIVKTAADTLLVFLQQTQQPLDISKTNNERHSCFELLFTLT